MRTPIEALQEIKSRMNYFCSRTDGKYNPPWAMEIVGICDDILMDREVAESVSSDNVELAYLLAMQSEKNNELFDENVRLKDENYNLRITKENILVSTLSNNESCDWVDIGMEIKWYLFDLYILDEYENVHE